MLILISIFVVSFILYIYFKVRITNYKNPLYIYYTNGKARIALGLFISTFGMNQYLYYLSQLALFICIAFLALGIAQIVYGYKIYKHYRGEILKTEVVNG
ncbi:YtpI family protein [Alkalibacillus aidingensis]|uniref:YtpI family protein n=1 Tax=Alkalibacillus aidingensis TaxID=2747607 RepID=UPI00166113A6|nr:YtpI family protein [Alkalibacillus aidingensis]